MFYIIKKKKKKLYICFKRFVTISITVLQLIVEKILSLSVTIQGKR